jgi:DNA-binding NarL/FixJ family response regulator
MRWFKVAAFAAGAVIAFLVVSSVIGFLMEAAIAMLVVAAVVLAVKAAFYRGQVLRNKRDVRMPGLDGIQATAQLAQGGSRAKILMMTTFNLDEYVYHAMKAGASGFLLKDATGEQLTGAIRAVCAGETLLAPAITRAAKRSGSADQ